MLTLLTLTAWIVTRYYWENASSAIASPREHLNGQENAWPAGSRGWCARGPRIETRGSHHIIAHPILCQIGFSGSGLGLSYQKVQRLRQRFLVKIENVIFPKSLFFLIKIENIGDNVL